MSHSIFWGLHGADLISTENKRATCNNILHVTDAAESHRQSAHALSDHAWHTFQRQICLGIKYTKWGLPLQAPTKTFMCITWPCYILLLFAQHQSEVYMILQSSPALLFTPWRKACSAYISFRSAVSWFTLHVGNCWISSLCHAI